MEEEFLVVFNQGFLLVLLGQTFLSVIVFAVQTVQFVQEQPYANNAVQALIKLSTLVL